MAVNYEGMSIFRRGNNIKDKDYQTKALVMYMFARTQRMFEYNDLPDSLPQREIEKLLQGQGHGTVFEWKGNLYVDKGGFSGIPNVYYLPTQSIVTNPYLDNLSHTFTIGKDCVLMKNDSYFLGLSPLFNKYAEMIATNEITMYNVDILSRIQALLMAGDSNAKKQAELYLKSVEKGDLAFINTNSFKDNISTADYAGNSASSLTNLIEYEQYLKASWLNDIGLNANWNAKRESLNSAESQLNGDFLLPFVDDMLYCREQGVEEINKLFGTNIKVRKSSSWEDIENRETIESEIDAQGMEPNNNNDVAEVNDNEAK